MIQFLFYFLVIGFVCTLVYKFAPVPAIFKYVFYGICFFAILYFFLTDFGLWNGLPHSGRFRP